MKRKVAVVLFSAVLSALPNLLNAQNTPVGIYQDDQMSELVAADPVLSEVYPYKNLQLNIGAGEGVMLYMTSTAYAPVIYTVDTAVTKWVKGTTTGSAGGYSAYIVLTPHTDTVIQVVYTTSEAHATGAFHYGIRKLTKEQMYYDPSMPFCSRLTYIINNWQCYFALMPKMEGTIGGKVETDRTLSGEGSAVISSNNGYKEYFFDGLSSDEVQKKYKELVAEIAACLPAGVFEQKTEISSEDLVDGGTMIETYFNVPGQPNEQMLSSFSVTYIEMVGGSDVVYIEFY